MTFSRMIIDYWLIEFWHVHQLIEMMISCSRIMFTNYVHKLQSPIMFINYVHQLCSPITFTNNVHKLCSPIYKNVDTPAHQFMVEPELFHPKVGCHDLVPQILKSSKVTKLSRNSQARSIKIWKDVKYQSYEIKYIIDHLIHKPHQSIGTAVQIHWSASASALALSNLYLLTTSMSWDNFNLNFTVTGSVTFLTGRT